MGFSTWQKISLIGFGVILVLLDLGIDVYSNPNKDFNSMGGSSSVMSAVSNSLSKISIKSSAIQLLTFLSVLLYLTSGAAANAIRKRSNRGNNIRFPSGVDASISTYLENLKNKEYVSPTPTQISYNRDTKVKADDDYHFWLSQESFPFSDSDYDYSIPAYSGPNGGQDDDAWIAMSEDPVEEVKDKKKGPRRNYSPIRDGRKKPKYSPPVLPISKKKTCNAIRRRLMNNFGPQIAPRLKNGKKTVVLNLEEKKKMDRYIRNMERGKCYTTPVSFKTIKYGRPNKKYVYSLDKHRFFDKWLKEYETSTTVEPNESTVKPLTSENIIMDTINAITDTNIKIPTPMISLAEFPNDTESETTTENISQISTIDSDMITDKKKNALDELTSTLEILFQKFSSSENSTPTSTNLSNTKPSTISAEDESNITLEEKCENLGRDLVNEFALRVKNKLSDGKSAIKIRQKDNEKMMPKLTEMKESKCQNIPFEYDSIEKRGNNNLYKYNFTDESYLREILESDKTSASPNGSDLNRAPFSHLSTERVPEITQISCPSVKENLLTSFKSQLQEMLRLKSDTIEINFSEELDLLQAQKVMETNGCDEAIFKYKKSKTDANGTTHTYIVLNKDSVEEWLQRDNVQSVSDIEISESNIHVNSSPQPDVNPSQVGDIASDANEKRKDVLPAELSLTAMEFNSNPIPVENQAPIRYDKKMRRKRSNYI